MKFQNLASTALILLLASCTPTPSNNSANNPNNPNTSNPNEVSKTTPTATNASDRSGSFVKAEVPTEGKVRIVTENGKNFIEFDRSFKTDKGPDLVVVLHRSRDLLKETKPPTYSIKEGDYINISPLQSTNGSQKYEIPSNVQVSDFHSVAIWCKQFNATFGTASLGS
ncbi:DM13 domain-containing protein [Pseudanabaena sp. PCC 6802]|uniref:DM13 domain-containing protein n=1 Tax=Pseudanabaena sp. PCC 6802 TaxID=118173 RepID=UPI0003484BC5|nr:DM13 domain-containing protein [Pseudanabaena sp. PCC 6802]